MNAMFKSRLWPVLRETVARWNKNDGNLLAASMAYYAALSFFPLLLILIAALGFALKFSPQPQDAQRELVNFLAQKTSPALAPQVEGILSEVKTRALFHGPVGLLTLLAGAIAIFTQLTASFDRIWHENTPQHQGVLAAIRSALRYRLTAFAALIGLGLLIITGFLAGIALSAMRARAADLPVGDEGWHTLELAASVGLNTIAFSMLYKVLPRAPIHWRDAVLGGIMVAVVWELGRQLLSFFIIRGNYNAYGVVGSFIAMMLWVYYASLLLFLGAQFVQVLGYPGDTRSG